MKIWSYSVQLYSGDFQKSFFPLPFAENLKCSFCWYLLKESCQTPEEDLTVLQEYLVTREHL